MDATNAYLLAFAILIVVMVIPSQSTMASVNSAWYRNIRPSFTPPNYVFPIVWTILYFLIAVALAQTLQLPYSNNLDILLCIYAFNLICNMLWSFAYFGSREIGLALAILAAIVLSTGMLLYYTYLLLPFWVVCILLPYQLWVMFAFCLNAASLVKKN